MNKPFRMAPHNIEAEQALLGAILVNNEAFYRVTDFLEPKHAISSRSSGGAPRGPPQQLRQGVPPHASGARSSGLADLHHRVKVGSAQRKTNIADVLCDLLAARASRQ